MRCTLTHVKSIGAALLASLFFGTTGNAMAQAVDHAATQNAAEGKTKPMEESRYLPIPGQPGLAWHLILPQGRSPSGRVLHGTAHKVPAPGSPSAPRLASRPGISAADVAAGRALPTYDTYFSLDVVDQTINPSAKYGSFQMYFTHTHVGPDPALGGRGATIPVVMIPIVVVGPDGTVYDPRAHPFPGDTETLPSLLDHSPLFDRKNNIYQFNHDYGTTQLLDAWVRAARWQAVSSNPDYHLLLQPVAGKAITYQASANDLSIITPSGPGRALSLSGNALDSITHSYVTDPRNGITPGVIPVFLLDYNIYPLGFGVGGYHDSYANQTYIVLGSFVNTDPNNPNVIVPGPRDGVILEHELAELIEHPFPSYDNGGPCSIYGYEVGDPLESGQNDFVQANSKGQEYHFQDLTFTSWNEGASPSTGINGQFTLGGTYHAACAFH